MMLTLSTYGLSQYATMLANREQNIFCGGFLRTISVNILHGSCPVTVKYSLIATSSPKLPQQGIVCVHIHLVHIYE